MGNDARFVAASIAALLAAMAFPAIAQQPDAAGLLEKVQKLETMVQQQQKQIQDLQARDANTVLAEELDRKLQQLRQDMRAEMASVRGEGGPLDLRVYWSDGLRMENADKSVTLKIGGRLQYDIAFFDAAGLTDGGEVRRAYIYFAGTMGKYCEFKLEFDFAGGDADLAEAYVRLRNLAGIGNVTFGHFDEPFGLDLRTGCNYVTFLERSLPTEAFTPGKNWGVQLSNAAAGDRMTWAVGVFADSDEFGAWTGENSYSVTGRITGLPVYEEDGRRLLHLGAGYSYRGVGESVRFRSRPESHLAPRFVDTGALAADAANLLSGELAMVLDSFSFQAEYMAALVDTSSDDLCFSGFSAQASYFLTGERRPYDRATGTFGRIKPLRPVCNGQGPGAWEIAGRYSYLDLDDATVAGGRLRDFTLAINWYVNNNIRLMWNYICAQTERASGSDSAHIFQMRVQVDF